MASAGWLGSPFASCSGWPCAGDTGVVATMMLMLEAVVTMLDPLVPGAATVITVSGAAVPGTELVML